MGCDGDHHAVRVAPVGDILLRSGALMITKIWVTYHLHPICVDTALNSVTLKPRSVSDRSSYDCHGHMYDIMALISRERTQVIISGVWLQNYNGCQ